MRFILFCSRSSQHPVNYDGYNYTMARPTMDCKLLQDRPSMQAHHSFAVWIVEYMMHVNKITKCGLNSKTGVKNSEFIFMLILWLKKFNNPTTLPQQLQSIARLPGLGACVRSLSFFHKFTYFEWNTNQSNQVEVTDTDHVTKNTGVF